MKEVRDPAVMEPVIVKVSSTFSEYPETAYCSLAKDLTVLMAPKDSYILIEACSTCCQHNRGLKCTKQIPTSAIEAATAAAA
nr:hypothetical protein Iba_chr05bCG2930 [Ipomoea batatas]GMC94535.1 hypothetical protein Iba_scaffold37526CG0030 [Ipomoea batatas]GMC95106.1 hypothetical protein Iba_chr05cCG5330 [Ipomoea batatas]GMC97198.1 hypothetical protein Iba_chr05dCG4770 [Ipomoea batatas]